MPPFPEDQFVDDIDSVAPDTASTSPPFVNVVGTTEHDGPDSARSVPWFTTAVPLTNQFEPVSVKPGPKVSVPPLYSAIERCDPVPTRPPSRCPTSARARRSTARAPAVEHLARHAQAVGDPQRRLRLRQLKVPDHRHAIQPVARLLVIVQAPRREVQRPPDHPAVQVPRPAEPRAQRPLRVVHRPVRSSPLPPFETTVDAAPTSRRSRRVRRAAGGRDDATVPRGPVRRRHRQRRSGHRLHKSAIRERRRHHRARRARLRTQRPHVHHRRARSRTSSSPSA